MLRQGVPTGDSRGHPQAGTYFCGPLKPLLLPCAYVAASKLSSGGGQASSPHGHGSSSVPFLSSGEHFPEETVRPSPDLPKQHVYFKAQSTKRFSRTYRKGFKTVFLKSESVGGKMKAKTLHCNAHSRLFGVGQVQHKCNFIPPSSACCP